MERPVSMSRHNAAIILLIVAVIILWLRRGRKRTTIFNEAPGGNIYVDGGDVTEYPLTMLGGNYSTPDVEDWGSPNLPGLKFPYDWGTNMMCGCDDVELFKPTPLPSGPSKSYIVLFPPPQILPPAAPQYVPAVYQPAAYVAPAVVEEAKHYYKWVLDFKTMKEVIELDNFTRLKSKEVTFLTDNSIVYGGYRYYPTNAKQNLSFYVSGTG